MGKRAKRLRSRNYSLGRQVVQLKHAKDLRHGAEVARLQEDLARARAELAQARRRLQGVEELACFRAAVRQLPFGRMGGDVYKVEVAFDPRMVEYGLALSRRPGDYSPYNLSAQIHYMVEELARRIEQELHKQLAELNYGAARR